ncbi:MAG TPA: histidine kinase, partial [Polyangiaceae bacterium]|nr:histidine kinase [Polyangiaceae bacterium]
MAPDVDFFSGSGEVSGLIRAKDWTHTSLGPVETWSPSMRTVLQLMLRSRYAMWLGWGPELTFFYNDAYAAQTLGTKHPWALGQPAHEVWTEIWHLVGPRIAHVMKTGNATWDEGLQLFLERSGYSEETYHTFSYSPAPGDASGQIGGLFCVVIEETERVIADRRLSLLRDFAASLSQTKTAEGVLGALAQCLGKDARDLPFSLCYLFSEDGKSVRRAAFTGFDGTEPEAAPSFLLNLPGFWPFQELSERASEVVIELDPERAWPRGAWKLAPSRALAVPIAEPGEGRPRGVFIAGLNPHRVLDDSLRSFVTLFVGQLAAGLSNAGAYEAAQKRAEALAQIDRAKTAFFSNVSHEFRTPLTLML